jgi:proline iminopeptidase
MLTLYPAIKPYAEHNLKVDELHTLFFEECGEPSGIPIVFLHGGPGSGIDADHRRFFDPKLYRIILVDQRGCGKSTPRNCIINNTTQDLVADLEKIRDYLEIKKWMLFGGSWGATLALLYAQEYPKHVSAMILRGVFLGRPLEIDWLYKAGGVSKFFPEDWDKFVTHVPEEKRGNMLQAYYDLIHGKDELLHMAAAKAWGLWEAECSTLEINPDTLAAMETHYFINNNFISDNQILDNMHKIAHIRGVIINGRYDMICPLENAYAIAQLWPAAKLEIIRHAGHAAKEPAITCALIQATNEFAS